MNARHQDAFKLPLAALCLCLACSGLRAASLHESRSATCTPTRSLGDRREPGFAFPVEHLRVFVRDECERCAVCRRRAVTAWAIWVSPLPSSARSAHGDTHRDATTSPSRTPSGVPRRPAQPAPNHEVSRASAKRGRGAREHGLGGRSAARSRRAPTGATASLRRTARGQWGCPHRPVLAAAAAAARFLPPPNSVLAAEAAAARGMEGGRRDARCHSA